VSFPLNDRLVLLVKLSYPFPKNVCTKTKLGTGIKCFFCSRT